LIATTRYRLPETFFFFFFFFSFFFSFSAFHCSGKLIWRIIFCLN